MSGCCNNGHAEVTDITKRGSGVRIPVLCTGHSQVSKSCQRNHLSGRGSRQRAGSRSHCEVVARKPAVVHRSLTACLPLLAYLQKRCLKVRGAVQLSRHNQQFRALGPRELPTVCQLLLRLLTKVSTHLVILTAYLSDHAHAHLLRKDAALEGRLMVDSVHLLLACHCCQVL